MTKQDKNKLIIYIALFILSLLLALLVVIWTDKHVGASQTLYFTNTGQSMYPAILDGDMVAVRPSKSEPKVGDIILFNNPWQPLPVLHRVKVMEELTTGWVAWTKGDNNEFLDSYPVTVDNLIGVGVYCVTMWRKLE